MNGIEAIERISRECFRSFGSIPNARVIDDGRVLGVRTDIPINFFSGVAMSVIDAEDVPTVLEALRPGPFRWWISPSTRPADLASILAGHGLHHTYDAQGMAIDLGRPLDLTMPEGFTIRQVTELDDWENVFMQGFQRPESDRGLWKSAYEHLHEGWRHFVGYLRGAPVATTSVLLCGDDLAGIYHVVTLPPARGRGVGKAITTFALQYAQQQGAKYGALQSSEMGFSVYRSIGFVDHCDLTLYDYRPSSPMP